MLALPFVQFLLGPIGRWLIVALAVLALISAYSLHERNVGAAKIVTKIEKQNKVATHDADKTRKAFEAHCRAAPAAAQCVRDDWTRND